MKLKQRPEDFSVKESYRFDPVPDGTFRVYLMDKQKVSTFEAIARIREKFGLKPGSVSYCGLKDKQGRTEQLLAVDGKDVDMQDPDLRLKFLGMSDRPLTAANITSNRFSVTVRAVRNEELPQLNLAAAEVNRLGIVNYFDDQRFGSLKHGQGFIAKDLLRGDFEAALKNFMAVPSTLDRTDDAKVKQFWSENWGDWGARCPFEGNKKYFRILKSLRDKPRDFVSAFLQIDSDYRAMQLFTFQSYLWNEGARRLMQLLLPREHLFPMRYQAGTLLHHRDADPEVLKKLRSLTFPLLSPLTTFRDEKVREAAIWALGKEKLTLEQLKIEAAPKLLWFKHEERPLLVYPQKLVLGRTMFDELNKPYSKINVAFTLPPGSYATLVVKRLFHFAPSESGETAEEHHRVRLEREALEAEDERPTRWERNNTDRGGRGFRGADRGPRKFGGDQDGRSGPRKFGGDDRARDGDGDSRAGAQDRADAGGRGDSGPRQFGGNRDERSGGGGKKRYGNDRAKPFGGNRDGGGEKRFGNDRAKPFGGNRDAGGGEKRFGGDRAKPFGGNRDDGGEKRFGGDRSKSFAGNRGSGGGKRFGGDRSKPFGGSRDGSGKRFGDDRAKPFAGNRDGGGEKPFGSGRGGGDSAGSSSSGEKRFGGGSPDERPHNGGEKRFGGDRAKRFGGDRPDRSAADSRGGPPGRKPFGGKRPFKPRKFHSK